MRYICTSIVATLVLALAGTTAAHADITYSVNTDGSGDYTTLSAAVTAGEASGDTNITINVAGGPYNENVSPASGITWTFTGQTNADGTPATTINMANPGEPHNFVNQGCVTLPGGCGFANFIVQSLGYPQPPAGTPCDFRYCMILNSQGNTVSNCKFIVDAAGLGSSGFLFPSGTTSDVSDCSFVATGSGGMFSMAVGATFQEAGGSTVNGCTFTGLDIAISRVGNSGTPSSCDDATSLSAQISNCIITGNYSGSEPERPSYGIQLMALGVMGGDWQLKIVDTTISDYFVGLGGMVDPGPVAYVDVALAGVTVESCGYGLQIGNGYSYWLNNTSVCSNECQVGTQSMDPMPGTWTCNIQDGTEPLPSWIHFCGSSNFIDDDCSTPQQAACCIENTCTVLTQYNCEGQGGTWHSTIDTCAATNICNAEAACCTGTTCTVTTAYDCGTLGGTWHQSIATCADCNVCNNMDGVCCSNGICISNAHLSECETYGGVFIPCGDCTTADCSSTSPVSTINVPGDYSSVADAITAASDGNVIQIGAGTFSEGNINPSGKAITIQGTVNSDGSLATTIDGSSLSTSVFRLDSAEGAGTVIKDLILTGGNGPVHGGGIFCGVGTSPVISNCVITDCSATELGGGIHCQQSNATIAHCIIKNNSAPSGGGISCKGNPSPSIAYCTIMRNTADTGSGVYSDNSDPTMTGTSICQNISSSDQVSGTWTDGGGNDICCPGDTNGDGVVNIEDLLNMLGSWGACP